MRSRAWLGSLLLMAGCGSTGPSIGRLSDLERAERAWERAGIDSYSYAIERHCFCPLEWRGPVRVRVENGLVTGRVYVGSGEAVPADRHEAFPAVPGLFDLLREAIAEGAHSIDVKYDPAVGVPIEFFIDRSVQMADEELGMRVTEDVAPLS